jgi:phosphatidylserine/phosphatidylglycerophosphate/cardiolipin synthase-like enzyme
LNRIKSTYCFALFLFFLSSSLGRTLLAGETEVYFSPSPDCENRLVKAIADAQKEIRIAVYSINNRKIFDALKGAKQRGVKLRILTDAIQATQHSSLALPLLDAGFDLKLHSKFKIEHNKFSVYDSTVVATGSFNWTGPASRSNSENCLFLSEGKVIQKYQERFETLWEMNSAGKSAAKIAKIRSRTIAKQPY